MIKIVYACNDKWFDGLYLSILSILRRTSQQINFYLLSADCSNINQKYTIVSQKHVKILSDLVKSFNQQNSFQLIDCKNEYEKFLANSPNAKTRYSPYTTFRLFLDKFDCFSGKVIYLDVDTMACGDINELAKIELGDNEFAVCHDILGRFWIKKDYFNAGVILFNMDLIKQTKLFDKALDLLSKKKLAFVDQTALYRSATKFMFFENEYRFNNQRKIKSDTIIKHFCAQIKWWPFFNNIKQWDIKHVHSILKIHDFDQEFDLYLKMKKELDN